MLFRSILCPLVAMLAFAACQPFAKDKLHTITDRLDNANLPDSQKIKLLAEADSLATLSGNDSIQLALHRKAGELYLNMSDAHNAKIHYLRAVTIARKTNDQQNLAAALNNTGIAYNELFETDSAIKYYTAATTIYRDTHDSLRLAQGLVNMGILYKNKGEHDKAVATTIEAAKILERSNDKRSLSDAYSTLGNSLKALNRLDLALSYHEKALEIRQAENDSVGIAGSLNNIANINRYQKKYALALEQYFSSLAIKEKTGTQKSIANTIDNIAATYLEQRQFTQAKEYFEKALDIRQTIGDKDGVLTTINRLCKLLIETNDLKGAETWAQKAEPLSQDLNYLKQRIDNVSILTEVNRRSGKHQAALKYALLNLSLKDSLFNISMSQATSEAETRFRTMEKEHELTFVNQLKDQQLVEIKTQKTFIIILSGLLLLLILATYLLIKAKNKVDFLFKELAHRVENNLQILLGVLLLKKFSIQDAGQKAVLRTIEERINAMLSIHQILKTPAYKKNVQINMEKFITDLVTNLNTTFSEAAIHFKIKTAIAPIQFEGKLAVTIGLLINEILTNLYKHGRPRNDCGMINISLMRVDEKYRLSIADDCIPWQLNHAESKKGMGLMLIETLSDQLKGKLSTQSNDTGSTTTLLF